MQRISITFPTRKTKEGNYQVILTITSNYHRATKNLRQFCDTKIPKRKSLLKELETIKLDVQNTINQMEKLGLELTPKNILECYENGVAEKRMSLVKIAEEYAGILSCRTSHKTVGRYLQAANMFVDVNGEKMIGHYTRENVEVFVNRLKSIYKNATVIGMVKRIKGIWKYALDCGYTSTNPFSGVTIKQEKTVIDYLDKDAIDKLINAVMPNKSLQNIVDCALFQIASGLAYCDLKELNCDDVKCVDGSYYIKKKRMKTGSEYMAYILPFGVDVWIKNDRKLPVISNQKYNSYLKIVGDLLNIDQRLHTHLFRHTYCTLLLNAGVPLEVISKAVGHSNTLITQQFYAHLEDMTVINTIKKMVCCV